MSTQQPGNNVNIYATLRLIQRFCESTCDYKATCDPRFENDESSLITRPNKLVVGCIAQCLCPIANRCYPSEGWTSGPFGCER